MSAWETVIGLECHVQLLTRTKLFSAARAAFGGEPNAHTDAYTLALPGTLPVLNGAAVEAAVTLALAAGSRVRTRSRFARKHYFYPDLPKGYQISQYDEPIAEGGHIEFVGGGGRRAVALTRIHIEEDAGKNIHVAGGATSLVDLNRCGVPLVEVVSEPDLRSAQEAADYLRGLRQLIRYLGICDGNMEEGSLRCDANVSVRRAGGRLGSRVELKNMNSFKHVQRAIEYEAGRQVDVVERGGQVVQETRLWDHDRGTSHAMRSKEQAEDYRYLPEPDLPPLTLSEALLGRLRAALPELPLGRRARFIEELGLSDGDADLLTAERPLADFYEQVLAAGGGAAALRKPAANWVGGELLAALHRDARRIEDCPVTPAALAELLTLVERGTISGKIAKEVLARMYHSGRGPAEVVEADGLAQLTDEAAIEQAAREVLAAHPAQAERYRQGNDKLLGFFVGQLMRATGGKANPEAANRILERLLGAP